MKWIDLNADIGEATTREGQQAEAEILTVVSSANIACGGHAGDETSMWRTVQIARDNGVVIGAHPGYPDPAHFGRRSMPLSRAVTDLLQMSLTEQIIRLCEIAAGEGAMISYVKPHGALYNDAVASAPHADLIASTLYQLDPDLVLLGGPNSEMERAADDYGLRFVHEAFIDRRYTDDGHLQNRRHEGAVIKDQKDRMQQAKALVTHGQVLTASGGSLTIRADSLCLHGDSPGAVETARRARAVIEAAGVEIRAFAHG